MKNRIFILAIALLLALCCAAYAGELAENETAAIDLDGDGVLETISWTYEEIDEYDAVVDLKIRSEGADDCVEYVSETLYQAAVYVSDASDLPIIFITGDIMSDDYYTWALTYADGAVTELQFENILRGNLEGGFCDLGYGYLADISGNSITLTGTQDFVGTYFCPRTFTLQDNAFVLSDDGVFHVEADIDEYTWSDDNYALMTTQLPVTAHYESGDAEMPAGTKLIVTGSDRTSFISFLTIDGEAGSFDLSFDDDEWTFFVGGISEYELFDRVPYCD